MNKLWYFDIDASDVKTEAGFRRVERNLNYFGQSMAKRIRIERQKIKVGQSPENLKHIFEKLDNKTMSGNGNRLVYWKWHIKKALGLPLPDRPEQWPTDQM